MPEPEMVVLVRFKSTLPFDELTRIVEERAPRFRELTGLQQKYYLRDPVTGDVGGLYLWESAEAAAAYRDSDLRATIAEAYRVEGEPRVEAYSVFMTLRD